MGAKQDHWLLSRTMQIIIRDDTHLDLINRGHSVQNSQDDCPSQSVTFVLMVEPDETVAAVKAYIQDIKGLPFKKQKLLNCYGGVLKDAQTLNSVGVTNGSTLTLRYAPITQISVNLFPGHVLKLMMEPDDTIGDVKATIQEKEGIPFHKQVILLNGKRPSDSQRLDNLGVEYGDVLDFMLKQCGC